MANKETVDVFNAIAPLFTYFNVDLHCKKEALQGFKWLKKNREIADKYLDDISVFNVRSLDDADYKVFWRAYNKLLEGFVTEWFPFLTTSNDQDGAKCFVDGKTLIMVGDSYDCYPCYMDYRALEQRLDLLKTVFRYNKRVS